MHGNASVVFSLRCASLYGRGLGDVLLLQLAHVFQLQVERLDFIAQGVEVFALLRRFGAAFLGHGLLQSIALCNFGALGVFQALDYFLNVHARTFLYSLKFYG